jgi:hypothetical protein
MHQQSRRSDDTSGMIMPSKSRRCPEMQVVRPRAAAADNISAADFPPGEHTPAAAAPASRRGGGAPG